MQDDIATSIIIATYNRSTLLSETLSSLLEHVDSLGDSEILVINNNSSDDTLSVALSFVDRFPALRVLTEARQGLSYARNCGVDAAKGRYLVFLDDDVEIDSHWLPELIAPLDNPDVAISGGKVLPYGMRALPEWLPREYGYLVSVFDPTDVTCEVNKVMGGHSAIRADVLRQVGLFDVELGRKGKRLTGGEETELFLRVQAAGYKIVYTPHSVMWHKISEKLNSDYIKNYAYWMGVSEAAIDKKIAGGVKYIIKWVRSLFFPWSVYHIQRLITRADPSADVRYLIKRNYARGYLSHTKALTEIS